MPNIEEILRNSGIYRIAGVDEAGRGACAGPLLIAAVILRDPSAAILDGIADSKQLSKNLREKFYDLICQESIALSVIEVSAAQIDKSGVQAANLEGMRRAVHGLKISPDYVLTDGYAIAGLGLPALGIWKGDQVARTISAASIIAKVSRDRIMHEYGDQSPEYGFARHKGYGTAAHMQALKKFGPLPIHRRSFSNIAALTKIEKYSTL